MTSLITMGDSELSGEGAGNHESYSDFIGTAVY
jgi:hypothetical protein